uniref:Uncharacterized protein n=1 Tax=Arundo donax TaxID=35708 RepID=A0A0A8XRP0_ARUDO
MERARRGGSRTQSTARRVGACDDYAPATSPWRPEVRDPRI